MVGVERVDGVVGVVVGQGGEGDHLARVDVHDGGGAGLGLELVDALREFVAHGMGRLDVDRQRDRLEVLRRQLEARAVQVGEPLAVDVLLDAGDALVVEIGEAQHVGGERAVGVDPPVLGQEADARAGRGGRPPPAAAGVMPRLTHTKPLREPEPVRSSLRVDVGQHGGQQLDRLVLVDDAARFGEDRHGLDVGRHDLAVAVEDVRPRARHVRPRRPASGPWTSPGTGRADAACRRWRRTRR